MQYHTHLAFGGLVGVTALNFVPVSENDILFYGAGVALGALLPDVDHPRSKISNKIPILPSVISSIFGHRKFFHSILFLLCLSFPFSVAPGALVTGLTIGAASHILGDMMTHQGVQLLFPIGGMIKLPITFRTGGIVEQLLFLLFAGATVMMGKWDFGVVFL